MRVKQSRIITSAIIGIITETTMICVDLARCTDPEVSVAVGELSTGLPSGDVVVKVTANSPTYVG